MDDLKAQHHHIAFARYADEYLVAAQTLHAASIKTASWPAYYTLCLGIELTLKSYLIAEGADEKFLRSCGHSLMRTLCEARAKGLDKRLEIRKVHTFTLESLDALNYNDSLRYFMSGYKQLPAWKQSLAVAGDLYNSVASHVGARQNNQFPRLEAST